VGDHLREQRVVARARRVACVAEGIGANTASRRGLEGGQRAAGRGRRPVRLHRLHVHARLEREAAGRWDLLLQESEIRQRTAGGDLQL
jgi:hypothetical protein